MNSGPKPTLRPEQVRMIRQRGAEMRATGRRIRWKPIAKQLGVSVYIVREAGSGRCYRWVS